MEENYNAWSIFHSFLMPAVLVASVVTLGFIPANSEADEITRELLRPSPDFPCRMYLTPGPCMITHAGPRSFLFHFQPW